MESKPNNSENIFQKGKILLINKPLEWSSFDIVKKIRNSIKKTTGIKKIKVGHAGTLDPLATGLLIVCTGKFTKRINEFQDLEKEYTGTFYLGATTPSFDKETEIDQEFDTKQISDNLLLNTVKEFIGEQNQIPPVFSAINVGGKRAYSFARKNKEVKLTARKIFIKEFELTNMQLPEIQFRVVCSKGTYIRSLARDFGKALNSGAHLTSLVRTRIGNYKLSEAISIEEFHERLSHFQN